MSQKLEAEVAVLCAELTTLRRALITAFKECRPSVNFERVEKSFQPEIPVEEIARQMLSQKAAPDEAEQHRELIRQVSLDLVPEPSRLINTHGEKI